MFIYDFIRPISCFGYYIMLGYYFLLGAQVLRCVFPIPFLSEAGHAIIDANTNEYLPCMKIFVYVELTILQYRRRSEMSEQCSPLF